MNKKIVKIIRALLVDSFTGKSGKYVYGLEAKTCIWWRIYAVRGRGNRKGDYTVVQGRTLNTGEWIVLAGWDER